MKPPSKPSKTHRISHVCDHCRLRKLKCSKDKPSCARCAKLGLQCVYTPFRQNNRDPTTVKSLESELSYVKAQLAACSKALGDTQATVTVQATPRKRHINWTNLVRPVRVHGVWRTYYAPFSDLALFARDPRSKIRVADLFEQKEEFPKHLNQKEELVLSMTRLLPERHILRESKLAFETNFYPSYPFYNLTTFQEYHEALIQKPLLIETNTTSICYFVMTFLMLCLTEKLAIDPDLIDGWIQQTHIASHPSEGNLACLLYLSLYSSPMRLSLSSKTRLSNDICRMALEMGLFNSAKSLNNIDLRQNLWMGSVILTEPTAFDDHFIKIFNEATPPAKSQLAIRYRFTTNLSTVWKSVLTASDGLEEAMLSLSNYSKIQPQDSHHSTTLVASCNLTSSTTEFNLLLMQFLQEELYARDTDHLRRLLQKSFDELLNCFRNFLSTATTHRYLYLSQNVFCLKSLASYVLTMSARLATESKPFEITELRHKFQQAAEAFPFSVDWCHQICRLLDDILRDVDSNFSESSDEPTESILPDFLLEDYTAAFSAGIDELSPSLSHESFESILTESLTGFSEQLDTGFSHLFPDSTSNSTEGEADLEFNVFA
ncbi:LAFA_0A07646g1_1 [Lachancea sp. 'fantastica']|nr:LAFA_0A07646g1_1 [Lachancea sp. 'fantastica']